MSIFDMVCEAIFVGRGGQGTVTAVQVLAHAAVLEGKTAQAMPEFGAERRGAIVKAYLRVGGSLSHSPVKEADYVVVLDGRIMKLVDVRSYGRLGSIYIVNSKIAEDWYIAVDVTSIALKYGLIVAGWPVVNIAMAAAFAAISNLVRLNSMLNALPSYIPRKYLEANMKAALEAYSSALSMTRYVPTPCSVVRQHT